MQHLLPVRVAGIWPNQRLLRRAARCQGVFILALPGPGALAGLIAITGNDRDIVVQADQHASREWEQQAAPGGYHPSGQTRPPKM